MGRFDNLTTGSKSMLSRGFISLLAISSPCAAGEAAAVRSNCGGTLGVVMDQLIKDAEPAQICMAAGDGPSPTHLQGDDHDITKLVALWRLANHIKRTGSMLYNEAASLLVHERQSFVGELNAALRADGRAPLEAPAWDPKLAGHELLARLPLVRVPLASFGAQGGGEQSLLLPIVPSLTDVELAEHIELVKEVREKAHPPPGETFDRIKYRLLINALPSCVLSALESATPLESATSRARLALSLALLALPARACTGRRARRSST